MQERERILELVKNGVISTQEGLDLLESLVKKEDKKQENKDFNEPDPVQPVSEEPVEDSVESETVETTDSPVAQTVAPVSNASESGRKNKRIRLSKSEVDMARRLNVPLEEYAKFVKR